MFIVKIPTSADLVTVAVDAHEFFDRLTDNSDVPALAALVTAEAVDTWCHDNNPPLSAVSLELFEHVARDLRIMAATELDCRNAANAAAAFESIDHEMDRADYANDCRRDALMEDRS